MKKALFTVSALAVFSALSAASLSAFATGKLATISVIDRTTGQTLPAHYFRGEYWVAGVPGNKYAIEINNRHTARLLAVTSVDGVNVVTGQTAGHSQGGYVFSPWQSYEITGWRKSDSAVAAFEFTASPNSYAEQTGRPRDVGVIGVAIFKEKAIELVREPNYSAPAADSPAEQSREKSSSRNSALASAIPQPAPKLGTGHGAREHSVVSRTTFERANNQPDEVIRIRYDNYSNLVAMGVIRVNRPYPHRPDPFPESQAGYVPDPRR